MYQRRRQAASLVSPLVVTVLFVWACSSGDHEEASITTGGGAGSESPSGGASPFAAGGGSDLGFGGDIDSPSTMNEGGAPDPSQPSDLASSAGGEPAVSSGGSASAVSPPPAIGSGMVSAAGTGAAGAGAAGAGAAGAGAAGAGAAGAGAAGAGAAGAGTPAVFEPICDPADDHSTLDMFLPCDVSTALYACRNCHANPPVKGVFSSYVTFADIKPNAAQIYGVIKSGTMPRPPYTLSAWQKATALKWLGMNGSCAIGTAKSCQ